MAEPQAQPAGGNPPRPPSRVLTIAPELRERFGPLLDLIVQSESMNDEERQYWIDVLPTMNEEQVKKLEDILTNERKQLSAIDQAYAQQSLQEKPTVDRAAAQQRKSERVEKEQETERTEEQSQEQLLKQIQDV